jgi:hypothetical protein
LRARPMSAAASAARSLHAKRFQFDIMNNVLEAMNSRNPGTRLRI